MDVYELIDKATEGIVDLGCWDDDPPRVRTIQPVDELTEGGFKPGLHCITAPPATGKTAFCLQLAYLAAMGGHKVLYVTDEISPAEAWWRLTSCRMQVEAMCSSSGTLVPSWSRMEDELLHRFRDSEDLEDPSQLDSIAPIVDALWEVRNAGKFNPIGRRGSLTIADMGGCIGQHGVKKIPWKMMERDGALKFLRYLAPLMTYCFEYESAYDDDALFDDLHSYLGYADLIIIDPINSLRLFKYEWRKSEEEWYTLDREAEPRARMDAIIDALDLWSMRMDVVTLGVFHGNVTRGKDAAGKTSHPNMGDFKESSRIEYRAVTAWELVDADRMLWKDHPEAPDGAEGRAVALFNLKNRGGRPPRDNECIWLDFDGAHNLVMPLGE